MDHSLLGNNVLKDHSWPHSSQRLAGVGYLRTNVSGYGLGQCYEVCVRRKLRRLRLLANVLLLTGICVSLYQAIRLSFFRYDDDSEAYVYAQTRRDFLGLVADIQNIEDHNHLGAKMGITVVSPEHWPLSWYLRQDSNVAYEGKVVDTDQPIIVALDRQTIEVEQRLGRSYRRLGSHELRPGIVLTLCLHNGLVS